MPATEPLSIRQLEVFVALVEHSSFTRAAHHLSLSQSTVSGHVADLERRLGVKLIDRRRDGVRPTAAGDALLPAARQALRAERSARGAIEELKGMLRGSLVVGASTIPASHLLPGPLARFHAKHPAIRLQLVAGDSDEVLDRLLHGDVEVAVVGTQPKDDHLKSVPVGEDSLVLVASPGHPLAQKRSVGLEEVATHPLVLREPGSGTRRAVTAALGRALGKAAASTLPIACEVGSNEMLKALVRGGLGAAFTSLLSVREEVDAGSLVVVPVRGFTVHRTFHLVTRRDDHLSPAARAFVRLLDASKA